MFGNEISELTLTGEYSYEIFPNITGNSFRYDTSFLATLRALLPDRMTAQDTIDFYNSVCYRDDIDYTSFSDEEIVRDVLSCVNLGDTLNYISLDGTASEKVLSAFDAEFSKLYPDFTELKDLRAFVKRNGDVLFYICESTKTSIIISLTRNIRMYHLVQSLTSRLLPWFFKSKPLTEDEKRLVSSLRCKSSDEYVSIIEEFAQRYNFDALKIEAMLKGFFESVRNGRISGIDRKLREKTDLADSYLASYKQLLSEMQKLEIERLGIITKVANEEDNSNQLVEYFKRNKHVEIINTSSNYIEVIVWNYIGFWDNSIYERFRKSPPGYLYSYGNVLPEYEERMKLYDAIFGPNACIKVKLCGFYRLYTTGSVETSSGYHYPTKYKNMLPNPHLQRHSCLGNFVDVIADAIKDNDYIRAIESCLASVSQINMAEGATFPRFVESMFVSNCKKILVLPDGKDVTPAEAYQWLISQENKTEEE